MGLVVIATSGGTLSASLLQTRGGACILCPSAQSGGPRVPMAIGCLNLQPSWLESLL